MELVSWTVDYSVDIELIDEQHQDLVQHINHLYKLAKQKVPDTLQISDALFELLEHVMNHFIAEEELFQRLNFPDFDEFLAHNNGFKAWAQTLIQELGTNTTLSEASFEHLRLWINEHILFKQKSYAEFLRSHGIH